MTSPTQCGKVETTGRVCTRLAHFQVNGVLACERHLCQRVRRFAALNESGHLWASVQVLPNRKPGLPTAERHADV